jgi:predicted RNase H-like HicB family nuclease
MYMLEGYVFLTYIFTTRGIRVKRKFSVVIEHDEHGYYAYCPELPGCQSEGVSFEEVRINIQEAIEVYCETLSPEELRAATSKDIYTTALELSFG